MLNAKFDGNSLTTFEVIFWKLLAFFLWTRCICWLICKIICTLYPSIAVREISP